MAPQTLETDKQTHLQYLSQALDLARLSPPKPTNFRVGCVIVSYPKTTSTDPLATPSLSSDSTEAHAQKGRVLSTGYTLEFEGNTHAEQCALSKLAQHHGTDEAHLHGLDALSARQNVTLYTTLEPCGLRLSGNKPCVERIIDTRRTGCGIRRVIFGAREPGTFVKDSKSLARLDEAGVPWEFVPDLQDEILNVAKEGHTKTTGTATDTQGQKKAIDDISSEERRRQEQLPRNPKKRMMEV
ncbi:cytidine deaminase-like protein [Exophiala viscosa]|uniref:Cytidine deaminase-like protein n=1 Tax=Exophiala viscosa TaxID=2486360 RepID=A0AAN6IEF6_9EURO|nr:cytidine deaminase-like protein [Exophiala viscosa]KAI1624157.1 cytidine deaminase-like protein [Exophiala viscosa]